ncbi:MAG: hypothetical protein U0X20_14660 [Caldilineaceae bacterium]
MVRSSRVLRLFALAVVLAVAYFAQYIFDHGTLQTLYPGWMLERLPFLQRTTYWLAEDLYTLALWLLAGSAIVFGLLVPGWEVQPIPAGAAGGSDGTAASGSTSRGDAAGAMVPPAGETPAWIWLVLILVVAAIFLGWGWTSLPVRIDPQVARSGLQAQALLSGPTAVNPAAWLAPGATGAPQIAYFPATLAALALRSNLAGAHLVGLLAALALIAAAYLLAGELFWISPQRRGLAVLAAGFTAAAVALLHFGRLAPFLPATAAGTFAAWALLAGHRKQHLPLLAASGILAAGALWFDRSGLIFAPVLLLWWLGLRLQKPFSWRLFAVWLASYLVFTAPLLIAWILNPGAFHAYLQGGPDQGVVGDVWANLRATVTTLFWTPDSSSIFGYPGHFVHSVVAPLFILGLGGLLLNLDRLIGWCLLTLLGCTLLLAGTLSPAAPYWPLLLPLLPVVGITVVFALNRMAALWTLASNEAGSTAAASLAGGLLIAVVVLAWVSYYGFVSVENDGASYTGRALATLPPSAVAVLVSSTPEAAVRLDDPVLQYVAGSRVNQALAVGPDALPATLPPESQVIIQGSDPVALAAARARYPAATLTVERDLQANPRLFVLHLP